MSRLLSVNLRSCNLAPVTLVIASNICMPTHLVSGVSNFNGTTEEYRCRRRRLLPAVCGAADVTGGDDGNGVTVFAVFFFFFKQQQQQKHSFPNLRLKLAAI